MLTATYTLPFTPLLADTQAGWLAIFAASGVIATYVIGVIMLTVWFTGGLRGGN